MDKNLKLSSIDLDDNDYWYLRRMLDVILPVDNTAKFGNSPLIDYLYKIKVLIVIRLMFLVIKIILLNKDIRKEFNRWI